MGNGVEVRRRDGKWGERERKRVEVEGHSEEEEEHQKGDLSWEIG